MHHELCAGRAGNEFKMVDELAAWGGALSRCASPGADIVWMHDAAEAGAACAGRGRPYGR